MSSSPWTTDAPRGGGIFRGIQDLIRDGEMMNTVKLRDLRARVRQTTSLISAGSIKERMGPNWAAEMETRTIIWRPTLPFPPFDALTQDDVLYLIAHEGSHLNWSGGYDIDALLPQGWRTVWAGHAARFHRFVNAVEDIRVDRLSAKEFGTFEELALKIDKKIFDEMKKTKPEGWHILDQLAMSWIGMDRGFEPLGSRDGVRKAKRLYKKINLLANVDTTQKVAEGLLPIYLKLVDKNGKEDKNEDQEDGTDSIMILISEDALDGLPREPSSQPSRSSGKDGSNKNATLGERLDGMAQDSTDPVSKRQIQVMIVKRGEQETGGNKAANRLGEGKDVHKPEHKISSSTGLGVGVGTSADVAGEASWETWKAAVRPEINTLANRLKAVLRTNGADNMTGGHRRGRLQTSKAYRAQAGNPRIFRKRGALGSLDYTLGIIIDCSGSMSGTNMSFAQKGIVMVSEAWERAGLESFIIPWDDKLKGYKPIGQTLKGHRYHLGTSLHAGGGTYEAPALVLAQDEFKKTRSGHRLMFAITDGGTSNMDESRQLLGELHEMGVKTVGIGIGFDPPRHYSTTLKVSSAEELAVVMPRFINDMVRKGR